MSTENTRHQQDAANMHELQDKQDLPPFVKTWKQFYLLLIGWLILLIVAFYIFTKYTQ